MFVSSNGHTGRQRRLGKDVGERTDQEVERDLFVGQGSAMFLSGIFELLVR